MVIFEPYDTLFLWNCTSHKKKLPRPTSSCCSCIASLILILLSIAVLICALRLEPNDAQCVQRSFAWSPASDQIEYHWETFDNIDFFTKTPYFGLVPTDEIEDAWNDILPVHPIAIPSSRIQDLNQSDPSDDASWIRSPEDANSVLALPEVFVQLGCLNFLRQWSYSPQRDFTHLASFRGGKDLMWERTHQCLERLRQSVMCWADTGVLIKKFKPHPKMGHEHQLVFDMGTFHNCRNFDRIREWTEENAVESVTMDNLWWGGSADI